MILGIQMPEGAEVTTTSDGKVLISWDEKKSKRDLFTARMDLWLTEGRSSEEFFANPSKIMKGLVVTPRGKVELW